MAVKLVGSRLYVPAASLYHYTPRLFAASFPCPCTTSISISSTQHGDTLRGMLCRASLQPQRKWEEAESARLPEFMEIDEDEVSDSVNFIFETDQAVKTTRHYEVVFLVHEDRVDELEDVVKKVKGYIKEKKGKIWRFNDWGLRRLAYKIKKAKRANYILMNIEIEAKSINDFKSLLDKDERVIRHLVITRKKAMTEKTEPPPEFSSLQNDEHEEEDSYDDDEDFEEEEEEDDDDDDDEEEKEEEGDEAHGAELKEKTLLKA